jgi:peptide/nickel transport system permease protein
MSKESKRLKKHAEKQKKHSQWGDVMRRLFRNKLATVALVFVIFLVLVAIFAPVIAPYDYKAQDYANRLAPLSMAHPFGTDEYGRDILSRMIYGARTSLLVALGGVVICLVIGGVLGLITGFFGGWVDTIIMRILDIFMAIPALLLAVVIQAALGTGLFNTCLAVSVAGIPATCRVMRSSVMTMRDQEFVEAAIATGSSKARIIARHILPNCLAPILVESTLKISGNIMAISGLSFVGLGVQAPEAEWGAMVSSGRMYVRDYSPLVLFPGFAIVLTLVAFNILGDGLRDALDPKLKQ